MNFYEAVRSFVNGVNDSLGIIKRRGERSVELLKREEKTRKKGQRYMEREGREQDGGASP